MKKNPIGVLLALALTGAYAETYGTGSSARATINQVYFTVQTAPVPEPETYAMLLAGLGILGAVARRRSCPL